MKCLSYLACVLTLLVMPAMSQEPDTPPEQPDGKSKKAESASEKTGSKEKTESKTDEPDSDGANEKKPLALTVQQVAAKVRESVVVVTFQGRDGKQEGLGTGFVISEDGLIATNMHVIGEARPISVQFADGRKANVTEIHATEKAMDLAVIRIEAKDLAPLDLADSDTLKPGQPVVAVGNPLGFRHSVVSGVASEQREVDGKPMIQVAIPIERGNSGGPLLDMQGRVHGILTLKSVVTDNLGFAVTINSLKPLLEKPNPVPIERWITIGALNPKRWKTVFRGRWRQQAGRIVVDSDGGGFAGRTLCLAVEEPPKMPYEVAVSVRMNPDSGAAGLVFHSDGKDKHYGFYPSGSEMRLTRFNGPTVYQWPVLHRKPHPAFRVGEWNRLKVRVEPNMIRCYLNGELVVESKDNGLRSGAVGIAKYRETNAEFRNFRVAKEIPPQGPSKETIDRIAMLVEDLKPEAGVSDEAVEEFATTGNAAPDLIRREARALERQAGKLRELAARVHERSVEKQLHEVLEGDEVDLLKAALLIAQLDNSEIDVDSYLELVSEMVSEIQSSLKKDADDEQRLAALNEFLFQQQGFHGSRTNYYHRSNSYLNEVIDDREGLPITMSLLYMELARRLELKVVGVGLPGHFIVRFQPSKGEPRLLDPFEQAKAMTHQEALDHIQSRTREELSQDELEELAKELLAESDAKAIIRRMLRNLRNLAERDRDEGGVLRYMNASLAADPEDVATRAERIDFQIQTRRLAGAISDIDWMLEKKPEGMDVNRVLKIRADLEARLQAM